MTTLNVQSLLAAALLTVVPATASELWHLAPGEVGFVERPEHMQSSLTRQQFVEQWNEERRVRAQQGFRWDQLYATYVFVGPGSPPARAGAMTREQFVAKETEEARQMQAKGLRWNQLFGVYQPMGR
jgi:hypothetical protein